MHAQDEHGQTRPRTLDLLQHLQPTAAGHGDVEHHHVPLLLPHPRQPFGGIAGFAKYGLLEVISENEPQALPHDGVVFDDEYSHVSLVRIAHRAVWKWR